ncbi:MAG: GGDEF domain-containing protein [Acidimicrobiales bacterium]|nr:GGDEF domain-containing protein [Acidimicrobiales bacterium]
MDDAEAVAGDHVAARSSYGHGALDPVTFAATVAGSSDLTFVVAADTTVTWISDAVADLLGHDPADAVGRSIAEYVHPDDIGRAAEVVALAAAGAFDRTPITPALYRVRKADGDWVSLEVNAARSPIGDGSMVLMARVGGDLVLADRLLEAVTGHQPFDTQVDLVLEMGRWRHPSDGYAIRYRDLDGVPRARTSDVTPALAGLDRLDGPTPWDRVRATGTDQTVDDVAGLDPDDEVIGPALAAAVLDAGYSGCIAATVPDPLHPEGACIVIWTSAHGPTSAGHRYALGTMRRALTLVLQQRAQLAQLEQAARIDDLTGVASRARFFEVLAVAEEAGRADGPSGGSGGPAVGHALLYVDLDGFKAVNDTLGHRAGDDVLRETARRIAAVIPDGATIGRLGGDEFAVLCPAGTAEAGAADVAATIVSAVAAPVPIAGVEVAVGASVGVAVGEPGQRPQAVLDAADAALFEAKADGRGRWRLARTRG